MITTAAVVFWGSVLLVAHSYVLYPLLLKLFSIGKKGNSNVYAVDDVSLPQVYVVFAAYNEEKVIAEKLESIFRTSYPMEKLKVYVGSDNSTDRTNEIIEQFAAQHPQLHFFSFEGRNGKATVLNKLVSEIESTGIDKDNTVYVFTDANVMFTTDTLYELAKHFKNETIGQIGANILNRGQQRDGISHQETAYIQRENHIKYLEGLNWGSMMGAFGACHAMRANMWTVIPSNYLMEDFYLSMHVLSQNKKAIKELKAVCYEDVSNEVQEEFKRKTRIQAGNFQNLSSYWKLLFRFNAVSFCFLSHKVLRWLGPLFIVLAYVSNLLLWVSGAQFPVVPNIYKITFLLQNILLLTPLIDRFLQSNNVHLKLLRFVAYFYWMNLALVKGLGMYVKGVKTSAWSPTKRNIN
ncbi:MAG: glycosyltransferase [Chitinophagales bacterium]|nr:glycosyltransferase [Chitinophagales bacterium]